MALIFPNLWMLQIQGKKYQMKKKLNKIKVKEHQMNMKNQDLVYLILHHLEIHINLKSKHQILKIQKISLKPLHIKYLNQIKNRLK